MDEQEIVRDLSYSVRRLRERLPIARHVWEIGDDLGVVLYLITKYIELKEMCE